VSEPLDPATYLPGSWRGERALHDAGLGAGRFDGTATFAPDAAGLRWSETGRMRIAGYDGPARRELRVVPSGDGWEVRFADGSLFHPLALARVAAPVEHHCRADRYRGVYAVEGPDAFTVRWRVRGPRKDQRLDARYVRL
jgi:hypothetical protein